MRRMILIVFLFFSTAALSGSWEDTFEYTNELASELKKTLPESIDSISLKLKWYVHAFPDSRADLIEGLIIDNEERPRIVYSAKIALYDQSVKARVLQEDSSNKYKEDLDRYKKREEDACLYLEQRMEKQVYWTFTSGLNALLYQGVVSCVAGLLQGYVTPVACWYDNNQEDAKDFLEEFKGTTAARKLSEFLEMFVDGGGHFDEIEEICCSNNDPLLAIAKGMGNSKNIYQLWKQMKILKQH